MGEDLTNCQPVGKAQSEGIHKCVRWGFPPSAYKKALGVQFRPVLIFLLHCLAVVTFLGSHYLFTHIPCEANVKPALFYSENIDSNIDCTSQLLNVITLFAKLPFRFVLSCHDVI